jgi:transposase
MLPIGPARIFLCRHPIDLRKSYDTLTALAANVLQEDPLSGAFFVFLNRGRNRIKILYWDRDGFAIWMKRLERGTFPLPTGLASGKQELSRAALLQLLEGLKNVKKASRFHLKTGC